ncbi:MAG: hypothetical protein F4X16_12520 [Caldilineaceae bacterium SB0661_bin_34]|nr:hypothetical protein [Caldilineaceae bacterium SB0661_bin_34]
MNSTATVDSVTRTIRFYHVHNGQNNDQTYRPANIPQILMEVEALPTKVPPGKGNRYLTRRATRSFTITDPSANTTNFRFVTTRIDDYPDDESEGLLAPLQLQEDHGLADTWHCVFFPPFTLAIATQDTTTTSRRLAQYLNAKANLDQPILIEPIARGDIISQVMDLAEISRATIVLKPRDVNAYILGLPTLKAIKAVADDCEFPFKVAVTYHPNRAGLESFKSKILRPLAEFALRVGNPEPDRFTIRGRTEASARSFTLDLLLDVSSVQKEIRKNPPPSGSLDYRDAYEQINTAITDTFKYIGTDNEDEQWYIIPTSGSNTQHQQLSFLE